MSANKKKNTGPSIRKDETSEEETDDTGSEEEDEHEFNKKEFKTKGDFLLSLQSVTREQFLDKKSFARVIEEGQSRIRSRRERKHLTIEMFKWKDNTLKYRQSGRWTTLEYVNTKRKHNIKDSTKRRNQREEEGARKHQTYICITLK
ncbi:uncharacterized protein LOC118434881 [Folsomia candida]|uniref:uncharacterized protein LOC118434881 n=1 Tax=Folsomia candida TaxID=158441 RepID=UPI001604D8CA|nr:uncharacterized protein LOC118434881 [Folsomia candida]